MLIEPAVIFDETFEYLFVEQPMSVTKTYKIALADHSARTIQMIEVSASPDDPSVPDPAALAITLGALGLEADGPVTPVSNGVQYFAFVDDASDDQKTLDDPSRWDRERGGF